MDYSRASNGADQKTHGLWERDCEDTVPQHNFTKIFCYFNILDLLYFVVLL